LPNQSSNQTASSTLAKLLEVDSELAVTEADLLSIESVQEKRGSLKTISIFTGSRYSGTPVESSVQKPPVENSRSLNLFLGLGNITARYFRNNCHC